MRVSEKENCILPGDQQCLLKELPLKLQSEKLAKYVIMDEKRVPCKGKGGHQGCL